MFYDESRFGLITDIGRKWTVKGVKPVIPYQQKYEYFYLYQSTDIKTGEDFSMYMSHLDSVCFNEYLKRLSEELKDDKIVLIMDNKSLINLKSLIFQKILKLNIFLHIFLSLIRKRKKETVHNSVSVDEIIS